MYLTTFILNLATPLALADDGDTVSLRRPTRGRLIPEPRSQTDYTAYTLEPGEFRVSPLVVGVGMGPRLQLTTLPALDAFEVPNGKVRWNLLRAGPIDLALGGGYGRGVGESLDVELALAEASASVMLHRAWSVHARGTWATASVEGTPQLDMVGDVVERWVGNELPEPVIDELEKQLDVAETGTAVVVQAATDLRFNRRDSIVFQATSVLATDPGFAADPRGMLDTAGGPLPLDANWAMSLAYQVSWRNLDVRVGAGWSTIPGAWATQAFDLSWRFGGESRREEREDMASWRREQRVAKRAVDEELERAVAEAEP